MNNKKLLRLRSFISSGTPIGDIAKKLRMSPVDVEIAINEMGYSDNYKHKRVCYGGFDLSQTTDITVKVEPKASQASGSMSIKAKEAEKADRWEEKSVDELLKIAEKIRLRSLEHKRMRVSEEEKKVIYYLWKAGRTYKEISELTGRAYSSMTKLVRIMNEEVGYEG